MKRISSLFEKRSIFNNRNLGVEESWAMKSTDMEASDEQTNNSLAGQPGLRNAGAGQTIGNSVNS